MVHIIALFLLAIVVYPLILVLSSSISDPQMVATGKVLLLPKGITFDGYAQIFQNQDILIGYANTIFYTVIGTLLNLLVTVPAGYVLSKKTVPGNRFFMTLFMITMYFSGGMIPTFLWVNSLGLYNSRLVLIILGAFNTYNCIICRSFFSSMPVELEEAASIDGCSVIGTFVKIILPLSKALLGVMVLYFAVVHWNSYFDAMIYIRDDAKQPLQVFLRRILILAQTQADMEEAAGYGQTLANLEALMRYAVIVVSSLPLLIVYPFLQKYFDKGVMIGSVKGDFALRKPDLIQKNAAKKRRKGCCYEEKTGIIDPDGGHGSVPWRMRTDRRRDRFVCSGRGGNAGSRFGGLFRGGDGRFAGGFGGNGCRGGSRHLSDRG